MSNSKIVLCPAKLQSVAIRDRPSYDKYPHKSRGDANCPTYDAWGSGAAPVTWVQQHQNDPGFEPNKPLSEYPNFKCEVRVKFGLHLMSHLDLALDGLEQERLIINKPYL